MLTHASNLKPCRLIIKEVLEVAVTLKVWITFKVLPAGDSLFRLNREGKHNIPASGFLIYSAKIKKARGKIVLRAVLSGDDKTSWEF